MSLPNITFIQSTSGLGRPLAGTDYVSGYVHYCTGTLPSGFASVADVKVVYSVADAENLGITDTHLGETKSVAKLAVTTASASGDTVTLTYTGIDGEEVTLLNADVLATNATATDTAVEIVALINAGTTTHGFTASNTSGNVFITTKAGEGQYPNNGSTYAFSKTGTIAATLTQPTGSGSTVLGVGSYIDIAHYHISEYFRIQPKGKLYLMFPAQETTYTFVAVTDIQNYAQGDIKQVGVYEKNVAFDEDMCEVLQGIIDDLIADDKPLIACLHPEIGSLSDMADFPDLSQLDAPNVCVSVIEDGAAEGNFLFNATGKSIGTVGALLGAISFAKVSECIAWVAKFNMAVGSELDTLKFCNQEVYTSLSKGALDTLHAKNALFLRKYTNLSGSYWSDSNTCKANTSDYSTIENNRVYQKIIRLVRANMLPALSGNIFVQADGTLTPASIGYYESLANAPLVQMEADGELSAHKIIINPEQDVLATSTLELTLQNVPVGVARYIRINVGFVKSVS